MDVALEALAKLPPVPVTIVHNPVPTVGTFAASAVVVKPQSVCAVPASEVEGFLGNEITSESAEAVHGAFEIVQNKT